MRVLRSLLVLSFILSSIPVQALENDAAREEMPGQDANLTADSVHMSPTEQPPVDAGPSNYEGDGAAQATAEGNVETIDGEKIEAEESKAEIEVFVPKPKRYVWKDEVASGSTEGGSTTGSGNSFTEKLNKISGGGSTSQ